MNGSELNEKIKRSFANAESIVSRSVQETSDTISVPGGTNDLFIFSFNSDPFIIEDLYPGDIVAVRFSLDDDGPGNINLTIWGLEIKGTRWSLGEKS
jgi:hypothetical protein